MSEEATVELEQLPYHALKRACKERGIKIKNTDKKDALIKMLRAGETNHKPKVVKKAPRLQEQKTEKAIPVVPKEIRSQLEQMSSSGLKWEINEEEGTINFMRDIPTCANLDQPSENILRTARDAYAKAKPQILSSYD